MCEDYGVLKIRPEQLRALEEEVDRKLEERLGATLCEHWSARCQELGDSLGEVVRAGIASGRSYGFGSERDLLRYLNVTFALGDDFDRRHPEARTILDNRSLDATHRIGQLTKWARTKLP